MAQPTQHGSLNSVCELLSDPKLCYIYILLFDTFLICSFGNSSSTLAEVKNLTFEFQVLLISSLVP